MEETRFKKGDCVKLIDNMTSPIMKIYHIEVDKLRNKSLDTIDGIEQAARPIHCFWFNSQNDYCKAQFDKRELIITKPVERKLWNTRGISNYAVSELDDFNTEPIVQDKVVYSQGYAKITDEEYKY
jgi:hypothetical protein